MLDQSAEVTHVAPDERFIRLPEVIRMTGMSRTAIYMSIRRGEFPRAIEIGLRSRAWLESRVRRWMAERVSASRRSDDGASMISAPIMQEPRWLPPVTALDNTLRSDPTASFPVAQGGTR